MDIVILDVFNVSGVSMMGKAGKTSPVQVGSKWCVTSNEAVDSHIKFLPSNKQWIDDVPLYYVGFSLGALRFPSEIIFPLSDLLEFVEKEDAFALRLGNGLHDPPDCSCSLFELFHEKRIISGEIVCCRVEIITMEYINDN
jgi:hypothetical protein